MELINIKDNTTFEEACGNCADRIELMSDEVYIHIAMHIWDPIHNIIDENVVDCIGEGLGKL